MEYTEHVIKTPMVFDKILAFFKTAGKVISKAAHIAFNFCKIHAPLICLIAGTALTVAGFIAAWIWRKHAGPDQHIAKTILPISLFVVGTGLQIVSFIISAGRINALSKALAAAMDAGAVLGTATLAKDSDIPESDREVIDVARNAFSRKLADQKFYDKIAPYGSVKATTNAINHCRIRLRNFGALTWNDVLLQLGYEAVPEGYTIGWTDPLDFNLVIVDNFGNEATENGMALDAVRDNIQNYRIFFQGMKSLVDPKTGYKVGDNG